MPHTRNIDAAELTKFADLSHQWWDRQGSFKTLHHVNPVRLRYLEDRIGLAGKRVLDVGCGGGLLCEEMARHGAAVTGLDAALTLVRVADLHRLESGLDIEYVHATAETLAESHPGEYDVVTCMELVEHVPDPRSLVGACAALVRPGGHVVFSTISRTLKAWLYAVVAAEYVLGLIPRGTHDYQKLVRPSELAAWGRAADLELVEICGLRYNPVSQRARLATDPGVNYLAWMKRP